MPAIAIRFLSITFACAVMVAVSGHTVLAQDVATPTSADAVSTIAVNGVGSVNVDPDVAYLSLGMYAEDSSLEKAQNDVNTRLTDVTSVLTDNDVEEDDIVTSSYNVNPIPRYDNDGRYVGVDGYEVTASLDVTVRTIDLVGSLLDESVTAGANQVYGVAFGVDDPAGPASQARTAAVKDARAKADELAAASGMAVVVVQSIEETEAPSPVARDYAPAAADMAQESGGGQVPISTGQTEIRVSVNVVFIIEPAAS